MAEFFIGFYTFLAQNFPMFTGIVIIFTSLYIEWYTVRAIWKGRSLLGGFTFLLDIIFICTQRALMGMILYYVFWIYIKWW